MAVDTFIPNDTKFFDEGKWNHQLSHEIAVYKGLELTDRKTYLIWAY